MQCKSNSHPTYSIRHAYSRYEYVRANTIGIVTVSPYWLKFAALRLFIMTMPIQKAVTSRNGTIEFYRETARSNLLITPHRHNAIQNLSYCLLPEPPLFSLPSTYKDPPDFCIGRLYCCCCFKFWSFKIDWFFFLVICSDFCIDRLCGSNSGSDIFYRQI